VRSPGAGFARSIGGTRWGLHSCPEISADPYNTIVATIDLGLLASASPQGIAVTSDGTLAYLAAAGTSPSVDVINTATNKVVATIPLTSGSIPTAVAITPAPVAQTAPPSGTACNGTYDGTFTGNITVSNGQNCMFISGGKITGNVSVVGGNFGLNGATVGSNLVINAGSFTLTGATIGGNLGIVGILPDTASNSICGTTVLGNMKFDSNGTSVQIGSATPSSCAVNTIDGNFEAISNTNSALIFDNSVAGNMSVNTNTGPTDVVGNKVGRNLQCLGNTM